MWLLGGCHCEFILHVTGRNPFRKQGLVGMQTANGQGLPVFAGLVGETTSESLELWQSGKPPLAR